MGDICGMSSLPISPEQLATLPPDVRAVIEAIVRHYEERIARLEAELQGLRKTPQNSSLPPSTQHPHAKPLKPHGAVRHVDSEHPLLPLADGQTADDRHARAAASVRGTGRGAAETVATQRR